MNSVVIFGAGALGRIIYNRIRGTENLLFFVDNGAPRCYPPPTGTKIFLPDVLSSTRFDVVYIASISGAEDIYHQLIEDLMVEKSKINLDYVTQNIVNEYTFSARIRFLEQFSIYTHMQNISGCTAEVGVFRGDFARQINFAFPDNNLYLFDTFKGFDDRDLSSNAEEINGASVSRLSFKSTSTDSILAKMPFPEKCVIKKGYFPETFDIPNERFIFVSLDTDLYQPIRSGLEVFYPLMVKGGVILVHDYFWSMTPGVKKAVDEFIHEHRLVAMPIGDYVSVAIIRQQV